MMNERDQDDREAEYNAKIEGRREKYADRAEQAASEATRRFKAEHAILDGIPAGQPILVGHHSERRHRKDLSRAEGHLRAGIEAQGKAAHYEAKATGYGTHGISSDDPGAVRKLKEQLTELTAVRAEEVRLNKALQSGAKARKKALGLSTKASDRAHLPVEEHYALIDALDTTDRLKKDLRSSAFAFPWLPQFGNHTQANIKRIEKRIAELEARDATPAHEPVTIGGVEISEDRDDNRVRIVFPGKPDAATREKLKRSGFRWAPSVGAWQRQAGRGVFEMAVRVVGAPTAAAVALDEVVQLVRANPGQLALTLRFKMLETTRGREVHPNDFVMALEEGERKGLLAQADDRWSVVEALPAVDDVVIVLDSQGYGDVMRWGGGQHPLTWEEMVASCQTPKALALIVQAAQLAGKPVWVQRDEPSGRLELVGTWPVPA